MALSITPRNFESYLDSLRAEVQCHEQEAAEHRRKAAEHRLIADEAWARVRELERQQDLAFPGNCPLSR